MAKDLRLLLSRASRTTTQYFQERAAEQDLSVVQAQALMELDVNPGINVGALAAALSKDQASTSIIVDKLMSLGLVSRETDPADRRRAKLFLSSQAEPLVRQMEVARSDINRLVLQALGHEGSQMLETTLIALLDAIEGSEGRMPDGGQPESDDRNGPGGQILAP